MNCICAWSVDGQWYETTFALAQQYQIGKNGERLTNREVVARLRAAGVAEKLPSNGNIIQFGEYNAD